MGRGGQNRKDLPVNQYLGKERQGGREWLRVSGDRLGWLWWIGMVLEGWEWLRLGKIWVGNA